MRLHAWIVNVGALALLVAAASPVSATSLCAGGQPNRRLDPGEQCDLGREDQNDCCDDECRFRPLNASCDDENSCTSRDQSLPIDQRDHCDASGSCVGGAVVSCDDGSDCTVDQCHPNRAEGNQCTHQKKPVGTACVGEDEACCSFGACDASGACTLSQGCAQTPDPCDADVVCDTETCQCEPGPLPVGRPCDDLDACSDGDTCSDGQCRPGPPLDCDDGEICTVDACDPATGCRASAHAVPQNVRCDDELGQCRKGVCTAEKTCKHVAFLSGPDVSCTVPQTECSGPTGTCSALFLGLCVPDPANDGEPCTGAAGICRLTDEATCQVGACVTPSRPDGTICDDGNACTDVSQCQGGSCTGTSCDPNATCQNPGCQMFCGEAPPPLCGCVPTNP